MTLLEAIKTESTGNPSLESQLIESAKYFDFDLAQDYPANLRLVDTGADSAGLDGSEYIEDAAGIAYELVYHIWSKGQQIQWDNRTFTIDSVAPITRAWNPLGGMNGTFIFFQNGKWETKK